jgi:hypothetical protein
LTVCQENPYTKDKEDYRSKVLDIEWQKNGIPNLASGNVKEVDVPEIGTYWLGYTRSGDGFMYIKWRGVIVTKDGIEINDNKNLHQQNFF